MMVNKIDAAEQQLNTAIRLFFENRDHLSSYALAVASREVTDGVIQNRCSEIYQRELSRLGDPLKVRLSYWEEIKIIIKPEFFRDFLKRDHKWQNFLKHAKIDPDEVIEPFTAKLLALVIISAIRNYVLITQHMTIEMKVFFAWLAVAEPQLMNAGSDDALATEAIEKMRSFISGHPYDGTNLETIYKFVIQTGCPTSRL